MNSASGFSSVKAQQDDIPQGFLPSTSGNFNMLKVIYETFEMLVKSFADFYGFKNHISLEKSAYSFVSALLVSVRGDFLFFAFRRPKSMKYQTFVL
jgi:hypothetical protein